MYPPAALIASSQFLAHFVRWLDEAMLASGFQSRLTSYRAVGSLEDQYNIGDIDNLPVKKVTPGSKRKRRKPEKHGVSKVSKLFIKAMTRNYFDLREASSEHIQYAHAGYQLIQHCRRDL